MFFTSTLSFVAAAAVLILVLVLILAVLIVLVALIGLVLLVLIVFLVITTVHNTLQISFAGCPQIQYASFFTIYPWDEKTVPPKTQKTQLRRCRRRML